MTTSITSSPDVTESISRWLHQESAFFTRPIEIFKQFDTANLRPDLMAGLTVAVIMLPQAIAYALIAELPPQVGLYAAFVAAIVGVLWGSSIYLHTGPTNSASLLVLSTLAPVVAVGSPEYIAAAGLLAVMVGVARLGMGLARLGMLVNFVSDSVIIGFTAGAGILISVNQLRYLFGLDIPGSPSLIVTLTDTFQNLGSLNMPTTMIGLLSIVIIVVSRRINKKMPGALIAMVVTAVLVYIFDLEAAGVSVLGEIPRSLPPFAELPIFNWQLIRELSVGALAISALGLVEAMSITRSISAQSGERIDANQEFVGQGMANIAVGFFSGYTCSGSFIRSAVNYNSGARSPFAVIFAAILMAVAALLLSPMAAYLPRAALAGVLMVTAYQMVDRKEMKRIWYTSKGDSAIMIATLFATLALPLEFAVLTGVLVSFARYIAKTSMPEVHSMLPDEKFEHFEHQPEKPECPQLGVLTIEGSLYFGATSHVDDVIRAHMEAYPEQSFLLLRMHRVNHCDISGLHMLEAIVRLYRQKQGDVYMVGVRKLVWEKIRLSGFDQFLGIDHFLSQERAISNLFKILDPGICIYKCQIRAWKECQSLPKSYCEEKMPTGLLVPASANIPNISSTNLWQKLNYENGTCPIVIDVREPYEFENGHVPQAQLIPMPKLLTTEVTLPHEEEIILICRTGRRSTQVVYALQQRGYNNLSNMTGGMVAWENAGLPAVID